MLLTIGGAIFAFLESKKRFPKFNHFLDRLSLQFPVFGAIINKAAIARYARTLATMFAAGVPLVEAMTTVAGAAGNIVYSNAILRMRDDVATEEAGSLDAMLSKVADFYEEEVDNAVDGLSSLMEPMIMGVLGVLIGGLVIAMYLPIFKMGQVV